jgi:malic enzyme
MRPLPAPFDEIAAGGPASIALAGPALLGSRLLTKDLAFTDVERDAFRLRGLLPDRILTIEEQIDLELEHLRRKDDALERYIGMAALQDRNATLFYRLMAEHLEEFLPIVYTPTVGRACQEFSHIIRRTRGTWITPADADRIPSLLRQGPYEDVRLIVVTDNERILGLGDQGAGGMAIPIGKLALYTAASGIHPSLTLPVSLDVGTDNPALLADPLYLGHRAPRLRGPAYDALVEAFVAGVAEVWPGCVIQWEDFKGGNALRILDRYRDRVPSFNDDVQGTSAVVVGGVLAGLRGLRSGLLDARVVLAGAGAAGIGIARLLRLAMLGEGMSEAAIRRALVLVDSKGQVHAGRPDLDAAKGEFALPVDDFDAYGFASDLPGLLETIERVRPTILVGATAVGGTFSEAVLRAMAAGTERPIVMPLSNPTSVAEATPIDVLRWTDGRAIVATGSPFDPVEVDGRQREIGQANNVFIFPGLGLGAIAAEATAITDRMFLLAARALADAVGDDRLAVGAVYPRIGDLRAVTRAIATAVAREAVDTGLAGIADDADIDAVIAAAMWWPAYVPYVPARHAERRRAGEQ